jgi:hypothetical protein
MAPKMNEDQQQGDRHLDIPAESNREKHINFTDMESEDSQDQAKPDKSDQERRKQWQEGLEEGQKANESRTNRQ